MALYIWSIGGRKLIPEFYHEAESNYRRKTDIKVFDPTGKIAWVYLGILSADSQGRYDL